MTEVYLEMICFLIVLTGIFFIKMLGALKMLMRELHRIERLMRKIEGL